MNDRGEVLIGSRFKDHFGLTNDYIVELAPDLATVFDATTGAFRPIAGNVFASAINRDGDVLVVEQTGTSPIPGTVPPVSLPIYRSIVHRADGSSAVLACAAGDSCAAAGLNDAGVAVGYTDDFDDSTIPFPVIWDRAGNSTLLPNRLVVGQLGAGVDVPLAINDAGQIVGTGSLGSAVNGFMLTPLE